MRRDTFAQPLESSFLSCERDTETILRKLFIDSRQHSKTLKRLLVITNEDCLTNTSNPEYEKVENMSLKELIDNKYIILSPTVKNEEYEKLKAAIVLSFDNFLPNGTNPEFRDCSICIDVICNTECWELQNYQQRPFKILGYIDGILNKAKLSGIGEIHFMGCSGPVVNENIGMYSMIYRAIHGTDDIIPDKDYNGV